MNRMIWPLVLSLLSVVLIIGVVVLVKALPDKEQRRAEFLQRCEKAKFGAEQCAFLLAIAEKADSDADFNAIIGTATMGVAASSAISRK